VTAPGRAKVFRNIELRQKWLGFEPVDLFLLGILAWLLNLVSSRTVGWNLLGCAVAGGALRFWKRGKPDGFTSTLLRYYLRRPFYSAAARDREGALHPFEPVSHTAKENRS
jgi:hypothetical protein